MLPHASQGRTMTDNLFKARQEHRAMVQRLRALYPDASDADLMDTIEGESTLEEAIIATLRAANENDATIAGLTEYMEKLKERAEILKLRTERLKAAALQAAQEAGIKSLSSPDFTATVAKGKAKVQITGEVPETFRHPPKPGEPNKIAITDALQAGIRLPFAMLSNPQPFWTIRTK